MHQRPVKIASLQSLRDTWNASPDSQGRGKAPGIDGKTARSFAQDLTRNLEAVRWKLLHGCYQFSRLRPIPLRKPDDSYRIICIPVIEDRLVQRLILNYLNCGDKLKVNNGVSYGFINGRGVSRAIRDAVHTRAKYPWAFKSDITSFFDSIDRERLYSDLKNKLRRCSALPFLRQVICCEIQADLDTKHKIAKCNIREGIGLRQGMPLSPLLSNFVLRKFDRYFEHAGVSLIRYADDFIIFSDSEDKCRRYYYECRSLLEGLGHSIPDLGDCSKTVLKSPDESVEFLGFELVPTPKKGGYQICIPKAVFSDVKSSLGHYRAFQYVRKHFHTLDQVVAKINNIAEGYMGAYGLASDIQRFKDMIGGVRSEVIGALLSDTIGRDIRGLDGERRAFLGVR